MELFVGMGFLDIIFLTATRIQEEYPHPVGNLVALAKSLKFSEGFQIGTSLEKVLSAVMAI